MQERQEISFCGLALVRCGVAGPSRRVNPSFGLTTGADRVLEKDFHGESTSNLAAGRHILTSQSHPVLLTETRVLMASLRLPVSTPFAGVPSCVVGPQVGSFAGVCPLPGLAGVASSFRAISLRAIGHASSLHRRWCEAVQAWSNRSCRKITPLPGRERCSWSDLEADREPGS